MSQRSRQAYIILFYDDSYERFKRKIILGIIIGSAFSTHHIEDFGERRVARNLRGLLIVQKYTHALTPVR